LQFVDPTLPIAESLRQLTMNPKTVPRAWGNHFGKHLPVQPRSKMLHFLHLQRLAWSKTLPPRSKMLHFLHPQRLARSKTLPPRSKMLSCLQPQRLTLGSVHPSCPGSALPSRPSDPRLAPAQLQMRSVLLGTKTPWLALLLATSAQLLEKPRRQPGQPHLPGQEQLPSLRTQSKRMTKRTLWPLSLC